MYAYPVTLSQDDNDSILVTSDDFPELTTFGTGEADALFHAVGALVAMVSIYMDHRRDIPEPSPANGRPTVALPHQVALKVHLYRAMRARSTTKVALAARLGWGESQVRRLLDPGHRSRPEQIDAALAALGLRARIEVEPVNHRPAE